MCLTLEEAVKRKPISQMINLNIPERRKVRNQRKTQMAILLMRKEFDCLMRMAILSKEILIVRNHQWIIQTHRKCQRKRRRSQRIKLESQIYYLQESFQKQKNLMVMSYHRRNEKLEDKNQTWLQDEEETD